MGGNLQASDILHAGMTRKQLAEESGIPYSVLTNRMCGFREWPDEDLKKCRHILAARMRKLSTVKN